ncbi:hypothetical protein C7S15_8542 [Burkholderia cepacia]|nr:hypothetical protein [Burkholderia cepacia]
MNRDEISTGISAQAPGIPVPMKPCPSTTRGIELNGTRTTARASR